MQKLTFIFIIFSILSCKEDIYRKSLIYSLNQDIEEYSITKNLYQVNKDENSPSFRRVIQLDSALATLKETPKKDFIKQKEYILTFFKNYYLVQNNFLTNNFSKTDSFINQLYLYRNIELLRYHNMSLYCSHLANKRGCGFTRIETLLEYSQQEDSFRFFEYRLGELNIPLFNQEIELNINNNNNPIKYSNLKFNDHKIWYIDINNSQNKNIQINGTILSKKTRNIDFFKKHQTIKQNYSFK